MDGRRAPVWAGVDTHKDTHALCVLDDSGRTLLSAEYPATPEGIDGLAAAIGDPADKVNIRIDDCATVSCASALP